MADALVGSLWVDTRCDGTAVIVFLALFAPPLWMGLHCCCAANALSSPPFLCCCCRDCRRAFCGGWCATRWWPLVRPSHPLPRSSLRLSIPPPHPPPTALVGVRAKTQDEVLAESFTPAPLTTPADEAGDTKSLARALPKRLYLVVRRTPGGGWAFPQRLTGEGETMRQVRS